MVAISCGGRIFAFEASLAFGPTAVQVEGSQDARSPSLTGQDEASAVLRAGVNWWDRDPTRRVLGAGKGMDSGELQGGMGMAAPSDPCRDKVPVNDSFSYAVFEVGVVCSE